MIDRIGVKKGYASSIAVWALASLSHVFARSPLGFGLARFALGIGESGNFPSALKATADWFPAEERALATGIFNSGTSAGAVIAPMMIPWVAVRYGWQAAFYTTSSLGLLWFIGWLLFPYNRLQPKYGSTTSRSTASAAAPTAAYKSLLVSPNTWRFALSKGTTDAIWWFYLFWLPKYFNERFHVDMLHLGLPLIIVYVGATIGSILGGWLAGFYIRRGHSVRMGRRFAMLVCALCVMPVALVPFCSSTLAGDRPVMPGDGSAPGLVFQSAFYAVGYVSLELSRHGGGDWGSRGRCGQRAVHLPGGVVVDQLCAADFLCGRLHLSAHVVRVSMASAGATYRGTGFC